MQITILVGSYPPVVNSAARLYSELAESLAESGHRVTVISSHPSEGHMVERGLEYCSCVEKRLKGVRVVRIPSMSFLSRVPAGKPLRFLLSCLFFALTGMFAGRPDVVLIYSPPLYLGIAGVLISAVKKRKLVFNLQDIHPKVLFDTKVVKNRIFMDLLLQMEKICYKKADLFIVYSVGNKDYLTQKGVDPTHVFIVPNWINTDLIDSSDKMNEFRKENAIGERFIVSYAGSMEHAQGLEVIVKAAEALRNQADIVFVLAGEGSAKPYLERLVVERHIGNVLILPYLRREMYVNFLRASDVCLLPLGSNVPPQTVPGKLAEIMAAGRAVISSVNPLGDAAKIIREAKCGFCVKPGDAEALSQAVLRVFMLSQDKESREKLERNARTYAEHNFSGVVCIRRYKEILRIAAGRAGESNEEQNVI